jgi:hypothetical protein
LPDELRFIPYNSRVVCRKPRLVQNKAQLAQTKALEQLHETSERKWDARLVLR